MLCLSTVTNMSKKTIAFCAMVTRLLQKEEKDYSYGSQYSHGFQILRVIMIFLLSSLAIKDRYDGKKNDLCGMCF